MNGFERGRNPKEALGIGTIANAIEIVAAEYTNRNGDSGAVWIQTLGTKEIFEVLNTLSDPRIIITGQHRLINDLDFYGRTPGALKIWQLLGKFVKYRDQLYLIKEDLS